MSEYMTDVQVAHLIANQDRFDEFYTEHEPVEEYLSGLYGSRGYGRWPLDAYLNLCADMGIKPLVRTRADVMADVHHHLSTHPDDVPFAIGILATMATVGDLERLLKELTKP